MTDPTPAAAVSFPSVAKVLRIASVVEAASYLALMACMIAKYAFDAAGEGGVPVMGPVHGMVFLAYAALVLVGRDEQGWTGATTVAALVLSAVPFGGFYVERRLVTVPTTA